MQKTAEHVFGSVLCASSCFGMYRLCALEGVLEDFARVPTSAAEYQMFEQGEDRWLCTLLIRDGTTVKHLLVLPPSVLCGEQNVLLFSFVCRLVVALLFECSRQDSLPRDTGRIVDS